MTCIYIIEIYRNKNLHLQCVQQKREFVIIKGTGVSFPETFVQ